MKSSYGLPYEMQREKPYGALPLGRRGSVRVWLNSEFPSPRKLSSK